MKGSSSPYESRIPLIAAAVLLHVAQDFSSDVAGDRSVEGTRFREGNCTKSEQSGEQ